MPDSVPVPTPDTAAAVEWETFPLDPSWKGCRGCGHDLLGERIGVRPKVEGQTPEGIIVRVCPCGHITTMGPILPALAAEWLVRNV